MKRLLFKLLVVPVLFSFLCSDVSFGMQPVGSKRKNDSDNDIIQAAIVEAATEKVEEPKLKRDRPTIEANQQAPQVSVVENKKDEQSAIRVEKTEEKAVESKDPKDPKAAQEVQPTQPAVAAVATVPVNTSAKRIHALIQRLSILLKDAKAYSTATMGGTRSLLPLAPVSSSMSYSGGSSASFSAIISPSLSSDVPRASVTPPTISVSPLMPVASSVAQSADDVALIKRVGAVDLLIGEVKAQLLMGFYIASQVSYQPEDFDGLVKKNETLDMLLLQALDWVNFYIYKAEKDPYVLTVLMHALYAVYVVTTPLVGSDVECEDLAFVACIKEMLTFVHKAQAATIISSSFRGEKEALMFVSPSPETLRKIVEINKKNLLIILSALHTYPVVPTNIANTRILEQLDTFDPLYRAKLGGLLAKDPTLASRKKRAELEVMIKQLVEGRYDIDVFDILYNVMKTPWYKVYRAQKRQALCAARYSNVDIEHELLLVRTLGSNTLAIDQKDPLRAYRGFVSFVTGANFLSYHPVLLTAACKCLLADVIKNKDLKAAQDICTLMEQGSLTIDPAQQKVISDMVVAEQLDRAAQASFAQRKS